MKRLIAIAAAALLTAGTAVPAASANHNGSVGLINGWYHRFLGRCMDHAAHAYWPEVLRCKSPEATLAHLVGSHEYYHRNGCSPHGFIAGLYRDVLGVTNVCPKELHSWVCRLQACGCRESVAREFFRAARVDVLALTAGPQVQVVAYSPPPRVVVTAPPQVAVAPPVMVSPRPVLVRPAPQPPGGLSLRVNVRP